MIHQTSGYPHVIGASSYVPAHLVTTNEMLENLGGRISSNFREIVDHLGVKQRHSVVKNYPEYVAGKEERVLEDDTTNLGVQAVRKVLEKFNIKNEKIGLLVAITNTANRVMPSTVFEIIGGLGNQIPHNINALNLQNQGCATLLKAFEMAGYYLQSNPDKLVVVVSTEGHTGFIPPHTKPVYYGFHEIKSLGLDAEAAHETESLVESFLFGDGAVAFILEKGEAKPEVGPFTHLTNVEKSDLELLTINEGGILHPDFFHHFPDYHMSKDVPKRGAYYAQKCVEELFNHPDSTIRKTGEVDHYLIHTGSKKILDGVAKLLGVDASDEKLVSSYNVLKNYGNLSPCSVGFMMEELFQKRASGKALLVSFGVGFSASAGVLNLESVS